MRAATVLAALFLAPLIGGGFGDLANAVIVLLILAGVVAHTVTSAGSGEGTPRAPGLRMLGLFFALACISAFFTQDPYLTVRQIVIYGAMVAAYAVSSALCRDARIAAAAVWVLTVGALLICAIGVRDYAVLTGGGVNFWRSVLGGGSHPRLFGPFINPSFFAGFLALSIPIAVGAYLVTRPRVLAVLAGVAVVVQILALMLTGSKFGILSALFALMVLFLMALSTKSLKHARFRRLIVISAILIPLLFVFRGPVTSRIAEAESGGTQVHSTVFRVFTWRGTLDMIRDNPWFGVGPGAFETVYPRYTVAGPTKHAHNSFLQIGAESGLPALVALLAALAVLGWWGLDGILCKRTVPPQETDEAPSSEMWKDLVPYSGWPMMNCGVFAALAGSAVTNLADSNWCVIGILYPFWIMAGVLAAQTGTPRGSFELGRAGRSVVIWAAVVLGVFSLSMGLGDFAAPDQFKPDAPPSRMIGDYRLASTLCPISPVYHRELAKWLCASGDVDEAARRVDTAIRLSPHDPSNFFAKGMIDFQANNLGAAEKALQRSIELNPNATRTLLQLALVRRARGDTQGFEAALERILEIEDSDYEHVRGVPEIVDTSYSYAHAYFGVKHLADGDYRRAAGDFLQGIQRLEEWRSREDVIDMRRAIGVLTPQEESELLGILRASYVGLAQAYQATGEMARMRDAQKKADAVPERL